MKICKWQIEIFILSIVNASFETMTMVAVFFSCLLLVPVVAYKLV